MNAPAQARLFISCGEPSGDLYAGELVRHIHTILPGLTVFGLGGDRLASQGATLLAHVRDLAVVGLLEVVSHLRRLRAIYGRVLTHVDRTRPDAAVLIDYPDFNLRLARDLKRRGIPVVYYVSPQVWAWRRGRIRAIHDTVSKMLVIFPFEEEIYRSAGVAVQFVGHPLVDLVRAAPDRRAFLTGHGLDPDRPLIALLPGSRPREVAYNLAPLAGAMIRLRGLRPDLQFAVAAAPSLDPNVIAQALQQALQQQSITLVCDQTHALVGAATAAVVASGTATVETALLGTPMIVVYRLSSLTYALGRPLVRIPYYAMVNLIAERRVVPELIQRDFTPDAVTREVVSLVDDEERRGRMKQDLAMVRFRLGPPGASARAASAVSDVVIAKKLDKKVN